jgi:hypothetical protein
MKKKIRCGEQPATAARRRLVGKVEAEQIYAGNSPTCCLWRFVLASGGCVRFPAVLLFAIRSVCPAALLIWLVPDVVGHTDLNWQLEVILFSR